MPAHGSRPKSRVIRRGVEILLPPPPTPSRIEKTPLGCKLTEDNRPYISAEQIKSGIIGKVVLLIAKDELSSDLIAICNMMTVDFECFSDDELGSPMYWVGLG